MGAFKTIYKRELWKLLTTPLAAALLIFYLLVSGLLTLTLGGFIDGNSASLDGFFVWQPWLFLFIGSALTMGAWAEEYRTGAAELLLTMPFSGRCLVLAKFASALTLLAVGLLCTAPFPFTCAWLGSPDWGPISIGYLACLLVAATFLALGQLASACSSSQFVSFLVSFVLGLFGMLAGFRPSNLLLLKWGAPPWLMHFFSTSGLAGHFDELTSGRLAVRDCYFFLAWTVAFLMLTCLVLRARHRARSSRRLVATVAFCVLIVGAAPIVDKLPARIDCTADGLYTLDSGSQGILSDMSIPVEVVFVYSQNHPEISAVTRRYALRIQELLREFASHSNGMLTLREIYPDSVEEQDAAEAMGLLPHIGSLGDLWFLGAVFRPQGDGGATTVIQQFDADNGAALEYQLARNVAASQRNRRRRLGVFSTLPVLENINHTTNNMTPTWWSIAKLEEDFEITELDGQKALPNDIDTLLLVHPKGMSQEFVDSVCSYLDKGRGVMIALDPLSRAETQKNAGTRLSRPSELPEALAKRWGVSFAKNRIVADRTLASAMTDVHRGLEMLPTLLTIPSAHLSIESPLTSHLTALSLFCAGAFEWEETEGVSVVPLAHSTQDSMLLQSYEAQRNAADLLTDFKPDEKIYTLAVQIQEASGGCAVLAGDADWLHNSLCVNQTKDALGQDQEIPINDNAALLSNAMEFLCDDGRLIRLRSRGIKPRTFTRLEALGKEAERRIQELDAETYRENQDLRSRGMVLLQGRKPDDPDVQRQLDELAMEDAQQQQRLKERQRSVLFELRHRFDKLERNIALWNLLLMPAALAICACAIAFRRRR